MSRAYLESKIKEALVQAKGNETRARAAIATLAKDDHKLLYALAGPHLNGIVAYNVERVASGRADKLPPAPTKAPAPGKKQKKEDFGLEILKALAGNSGAVFGFDDGAPLKRSGASASHVNALKQIAAKSKAKPKK